MMRMLYRGGLQVIAENKTSFEDVRTVQKSIPIEFMLECDNRAVKILDPIQFRPPMGPRYKFILMNRDPKELIRSHAKWETGNRDYPSKTKPRSVKKRLYDTKLLLNRYPHSEVLVVRFEDILRAPLNQAMRVVNFLELVLDIRNMVNCVHKRSPECLPNMAEFDFEEEE
jgi:hypothetical protein